MPEKGSDAIFVYVKIFLRMEIIIRPNGLWDYTKPLRDFLGLVLAGRYFWVQNLGSSVLHNKLNLYIVGFFLFWY